MKLDGCMAEIRCSVAILAEVAISVQIGTAAVSVCVFRAFFVGFSWFHVSTVSSSLLPTGHQKSAKQKN